MKKILGSIVVLFFVTNGFAQKQSGKAFELYKIYYQEDIASYDLTNKKVKAIFKRDYNNKDLERPFRLYWYSYIVNDLYGEELHEETRIHLTLLLIKNDILNPDFPFYLLNSFSQEDLLEELHEELVIMEGKIVIVEEDLKGDDDRPALFEMQMDSTYHLGKYCIEMGEKSFDKLKTD